MEATAIVNKKKEQQQETSSKRGAVQPQWQRMMLLLILGYEGAGCLAGGTLLVLAPDGRLMDLPAGIMHGVFLDFLIPGIILFGLGVLNSAAFIAVLRRKHFDWFLTGLGLGGLFIWFVVEIIIVNELHWLHLMWGIPVLLGWVVAIPLIALRHDPEVARKVLLSCGILSSVWYIAINIIVPALYDGYSISSLTVSELSAIGAPTRILWVLLVTPYPLLLTAFGWGVLQSAGGKRSLKIVGSLIIAYCVFNFYWPPMHQRGPEPSLTDSLHIAWAGVTVLFMIAMMAFGAVANGTRFRIYTIVSIALHFIFGVLTSLEAPQIPTNGPTPFIGVWERINIAVFMVWIVVLAVMLRAKNVQPADTRTE